MMGCMGCISGYVDTSGSKVKLMISVGSPQPFIDNPGQGQRVSQVYLALLNGYFLLPSNPQMIMIIILLEMKLSSS